MNPQTRERLFDAGYETLFFLGGFLLVLAGPSRRNLEELLDEFLGDKNGKRKLGRLEKRGLISREAGGGSWVPAVTNRGRVVFAGGRNPETAWKRPWDGTWRIFTFDLPRTQKALRERLGNWLHQNHFGHLQGSVWIHWAPLPELGRVVEDETIHPQSMAVFEGTLSGNRKPREISAMAWDFAAINEAYGRYLDFAENLIGEMPRQEEILSGFRDILKQERSCWMEAICPDPLLPKQLHPKGYLGPKAWKIRTRLLKKLHDTLKSATTR